MNPYWNVNGFVKAINERIIVMVFRNVVTKTEKNFVLNKFQRSITN